MQLGLSILKAATALCVVLIAPAAARPAEDVAGLVAAVVEAYGGAEAVAKLEASRVEGEVEAHMRGAKGKMRRDFAAPERLRVTIAYPETTEIRILDGDRGWRGSPERVSPVQGLPHTSMVYQLLRSSVPWSLVQHRERLERSGGQTDGEARLVVLTLPWSPALKVEFFVDEASHRVVRVEGTLAMGPTTMAFATRYADFRVVEGLLVPHVEESFAGGRHTATTRLTAVRLGADDLGPFSPDVP